MVTKYLRPRDEAEALAMLGSEAGALLLSGGTQLLSSEFRGRDFAAIALAGIIDGDIDRIPASLRIGAAATFQDLVDSPVLPELLRTAARGMVDRNIRNRATVGGNLGADKTCSSLIPILLALDSNLELSDGRKLRLEEWLDLLPGAAAPLAGRRGIVRRIVIPLRSGRLAGYARWTRASCDISILGVGAAYRIEAGLVRGLRLVLGGMGPHARRFPALEALFEGRSLPDRDAIEASVAPLLKPISDARASAEFKRLRASGLVAEALLGAVEFAS